MNKIKLMFLIVIVLLLSSCRGSINIEVETTSNNEIIKSNNQIENSNTITEDISNFDEKEVKKVIDEIFENVKELNVDKVLENINYNIKNYDTNNIKKFLESFPDSITTIKQILENLNYDIEEIKTEDGKFAVKVNIRFIDIKKFALKIMPEIVIKNAKRIFTNSIDNNTIYSIIDIIKKELNNNKYDFSTYTYTFKFGSIGGKLKLTDISDIVKTISTYISGLLP